MKKLLFIVSFSIICYSTNAQSDSCDSIGITEPLNLITQLIPDEICLDHQACLEFQVENFKNVIGFQFTLEYDTSVIDNLLYTPSAGGLIGPLNTIISFNNNDNRIGLAVFLWTNANALGQSIPDFTPIFKLCFDVIGEPNDNVSFTLNYSPNGVTPNPEVNYQTSPDSTCSKDILLIDGADKSVNKICCPDLSFTNLSICEEAGILSFRSCGGVLPYRATLSDEQDVEIITTMVNSDLDTTFLQDIFVGDYNLELIDANNNTIKQSISIADNQSTNQQTYYIDNDMDGYGNPSSSSIETCYKPIGYANNALDCNDNNPSINPDATEVCDGSDNNCDQNIDEGFNPITYYTDNDGDGYGDPDKEFVSCDNPTDGSLDNTDCDDNNPDIYPGATEITGNGIDENCDGNDTVTSINSEDRHLFNVYPNPSDAYIVIEGVDFHHVFITNLKGCTLSRSKLSRINIDHLPTGLYFLHIINKQGTIIDNHKIIKF